MRRTLVGLLLAATACSAFSTASDDSPAPPPGGTEADGGGADATATDDGSGVQPPADAATDSSEAGLPLLDATVFADASAAGNAVSLATDGTTYLFWARPGAGLFRRVLTELAPAENYRNLNVSGVTYAQGRIFVALVPNGQGFDRCQVQSFVSTETATLHYDEACANGAVMTLATDDNTIFMMGPNGAIRLFAENSMVPVSPVSVSSGPALFGEGAAADTLYYTDSSNGQITASGAAIGAVLVSEWTLVGLAATSTYLYATAKKATGERAIVRATRGALPLTVDRVWGRPANVDMRDILALPNGHLYWIEQNQILEATPP